MVLGGGGAALGAALVSLNPNIMFDEISDIQMQGLTFIFSLAVHGRVSSALDV